MMNSTSNSNLPDVHMEDEEILAIRAKVREIEAEAEKLKRMQSLPNNTQYGNNTSYQGFGSDGVVCETSDIDRRSIYVGNVDYSATAQDIESHFNACGAINRVTILCDKVAGTPKGFAYIEFADPDSVTTAVALDDTAFKNRQIKVMPKRTNRPGISTTDRYARGGGRRGRGSMRYPGFYGGSRGRFCPYPRPYYPRRGHFYYAPY